MKYNNNFAAFLLLISISYFKLSSSQLIFVSDEDDQMDPTIAFPDIPDTRRPIENLNSPQSEVNTNIPDSVKLSRKTIREVQKGFLELESLLANLKFPISRETSSTSVIRQRHRANSLCSTSIEVLRQTKNDLSALESSSSNNCHLNIYGASRECKGLFQFIQCGVQHLKLAFHSAVSLMKIEALRVVYKNLAREIKSQLERVRLVVDDEIREIDTLQEKIQDLGEDLEKAQMEPRNDFVRLCESNISHGRTKGAAEMFTALHKDNNISISPSPAVRKDLENTIKSAFNRDMRNAEAVLEFIKRLPEREYQTIAYPILFKEMKNQNGFRGHEMVMLAYRANIRANDPGDVSADDKEALNNIRSSLPEEIKALLFSQNIYIRSQAGDEWPNYLMFYYHPDSIAPGKDIVIDEVLSCKSIFINLDNYKMKWTVEILDEGRYFKIKMIMNNKEYLLKSTRSGAIKVDANGSGNEYQWEVIPVLSGDWAYFKNRDNQRILKIGELNGFGDHGNPLPSRYCGQTLGEKEYRRDSHFFWAIKAAS